MDMSDGDLVPIFVVKKFLNVAAKQNARAAGRLADLRDINAARIVNGSRLKTEKHRAIALGRNAAHHAALFQNGIIFLRYIHENQPAYIQSE